MEAILGAAFLSGGRDLALKTGSRLGLCFGGETLWENRSVDRKEEDFAVPPNLVRLMTKLEMIGGYKFKSARLLLQAVTHRSYERGSACYEREEYLGDGKLFSPLPLVHVAYTKLALLDFFITSHLFKRFPDASPSNVTFLRAMLVSNSALAFLAVRVLKLNTVILHSSITLQAEMIKAASEMAYGGFDMILEDLVWLTDPPKVRPSLRRL